MFIGRCVARLPSHIQLQRRNFRTSPSHNLVKREENWRKSQLNQLSEKFASSPSPQSWPTDNIPPLNIGTYEEVQPMWKAMESRVTKRPPPMTLKEAKAKNKVTGRKNIKKTEEEYWFEEGVYDENKT